MIDSGYLPGESFLHRFDPRIKLLTLLLLSISFFFPLSLPAYGLYLLLPVSAAILSLGFKELWIPIRTILPLLVLVALLTPPFHPSGEELFSVGEIAITTAGLREALRLIFRFTGITLSFFLFFRSTDIETMVLTLSWYRLPYSFALILTIAFRYIPYIASLYRAVSDAHKLRRPARDGRGRWFGIRRRFTHIFPTLVSVMIHSVKSIPSLSMSLETRGFGRHERRSSLYHLPALRSRRGSLLALTLISLLIFLPLFLL